MTYTEATNVKNAIQQWHQDWQISIRTSGLTNSASYTLEITKGQKIAILSQLTDVNIQAIVTTLRV